MLTKLEVRRRSVLNALVKTDGEVHCGIVWGNLSCKLIFKVQYVGGNKNNLVKVSFQLFDEMMAEYIN